MNLKILLLLTFFSISISDVDTLSAMKRKKFEGQELSTQLVKRQAREERLEAERVNYFKRLPDEILILILNRVADKELFESVSRVCKNWHAIIFDKVLRSISFSNSKITKLPISFFKLKNVKELDLSKIIFSKTRIMEQTQSLGKLSKSITKLSLRHCLLGGVPKGLGKLDQLQELDLSGNPLLEELSVLPVNLRTLNLSKCAFQLIPQEVKLLGTLETLSLKKCGKNSYTGFKPLSLYKTDLYLLPSTLQELNVEGCFISKDTLNALRKAIPGLRVFYTKATDNGSENSFSAISGVRVAKLRGAIN